MKRLLSIFTFCCLLSIIAFAQAYLPHTRMHFKIAPTTPSWPWGNITNNTDGTLPYDWYVAQYYYTNGSTVVLPDLYTNALHLTNSGSASSWPVYGATLINGKPAIQFDGVGTYLKNVLFTNTLPHDVWIVMYENGTPSDNNHVYFDSANSSYREWFLPPNAGVDRLYLLANGGNLVVSVNGPKSGISNKWTVIELKAEFVQSFIRTNNVDCTLGGGGTLATMSGLSIATLYNVSVFSKYNLAEFISYNFTNNTVQRSNIFSYLTNKYSLP